MILIFLYHIYSLIKIEFFGLDYESKYFILNEDKYTYSLLHF
jgi:hypothetical protein